MLTLGEATVNLPLFFGLIAAALADLYFRYAAFGSLDSVGIDIALYTFLFSISEVFNAVDEERGEWYVKSIIGLAVLLGLSTIHTVAYRFTLQEQMRDYLDDAIDRAPPEKRPLMRAAVKVIRRSIPLTVEVTDNGLRRGKRAARVQAAALLREIAAVNSGPATEGAEIGAEPLPDFEQAFLLPRRHRLILSIAFAVGGAIALLTPVVSLAA